jgi:trafficking protein particle complex subunit 4
MRWFTTDRLRRTVFALIIINKAGGLIYNRSFHDGGLNKLSINDYLIVAGTFHRSVSVTDAAG